MSDDLDSARVDGDLDGSMSLEPSIDVPGASVNSGDAAAESVDGQETSAPTDQQYVREFHLPNVQEAMPSEVDVVHHTNGDSHDSMQETSNVVKTSDDVAKEDMFVDCPDELNTDVKEGVEVLATSLKSEDEDVPNDAVSETEHKEDVPYLKEEIEFLRHMLGKTSAEKDSFTQEYEKEREAFMYLHRQLTALSERQSSQNVEGGHFIDHETGDIMVKTLPSNTQPLEILNECSVYVERAMDQHSQMENTVRELHTILYTKDQELEILKQRDFKLSAIHKIIQSFLNSVQENMLKYTDVPSEINLDKDHQIETITTRILSSLAAIISSEKMLDESITDEISNVESSTSLLIDKYNRFVSEIHLLSQCLLGLGVPYNLHDETEIMHVACSELLQLKRRQLDLEERLNHLDDENRKLVEQLDQNKHMNDAANAEIRRINSELEQEKTRYMNTKEKLSMAVTKGKALVQQRDSLKQSLADKTHELEKCSIELEEKSSAMELGNKAFVDSQNWAASMQEALSERDVLIKKCEEILSNCAVPDELHSFDIAERVKWLSLEKNAMNVLSSEFDEVTNFLSSIDFPETVTSGMLSRVRWLAESFFLAKDEITILQDEIHRTSEAAQIEIDHLTSSFLTEILLKNYLQEEFEDLTRKYEEIVANENQVLLDKDRLVGMLIEASGVTAEALKEIHHPQSGGATIVDRCFEKIKERISASVNFSPIEIEKFETFQSLLYVGHQESVLHAQILEEDMLNGLEQNHLSDQLSSALEELVALKDEKGSLQIELERLEEKTALLREKLSMAVKKGKGLVQERENLKHRLEDKNSEIEKLKHDIEEKELAISSHSDQIHRLSTDFLKLEADLGAMKDQRDHFEQFLAESNGKLQRVLESIDGISIPTDSVFDEPAEKIKWVAVFIRDCLDAKSRAEEELEKVKNEISTVTFKLAEFQSMTKSLEDALSVVQKNILQLAEEKRELEVARTHAEDELQKAIAEASSHSSRLAEVSLTRKSLEDAVSLAEHRVAFLITEKEENQVTRATLEMELQKVRDECSVLSSKLAESANRVELLEDALSVAQKHILQLAEEKRELEVAKTHAEDELQKAIAEASSHNRELAEVSLTRKSLEDAVSLAENRVALLITEKEENQANRATLETELQKVKDEYSVLISKLADSVNRVELLEDALSVARKNNLQLAEENRELELAKTHTQDELHKAIAEASSHNGELAEVSLTRKSLEHAVSLAEDRVALLITEKEENQASRATLEMELQKVKGEYSVLTSKLADSINRVELLEDTISKQSSNVCLLEEENKVAQIDGKALKDEIEKLKEEADSQARKVAVFSSRIKSLEHALLKAENSVSSLLSEKKITEQEILTLNSKLNACMQELEGTHGNVGDRIVELSVHLNRLLLLLEDESLPSLLIQCFEKNFEGLKNLNVVLTDVNNLFIEIDPKTQQNYQVSEEYSSVPNSSLAENVVNIETVNGERDLADAESISLYIGKAVERFHLRDKILADKIEIFSVNVNRMITDFYGKLESTRGNLSRVFDEMKSLKHKVNILETDREVQEQKVVALENDFSILSTACNNAIQELEFEVKNNILHLGSVPELEKLNHSVLPESAVDGDVAVEHQQRLGNIQCSHKLDNFINATRNVQVLCNYFQKERKSLATDIEDLKIKLEDSKLICSKNLEERNLYQQRVAELVTDLKELEDSRSEMKLQINDYEAKEYNMTQKEAELSSMLSASITKRPGAGESLLSDRQLKFLFDMINAIEIPFLVESEVEYPEPHDLANVNKLFNIIGSISKLQHEVTSLSSVKQNMQSSLKKQDLEIQHLKEEVEEYARNKQDSENMKRQLLELRISLENIIQKLGGSVTVDSWKSAGPIELLPILEKLIRDTILEVENSKSKAQELDSKLHETQTFINELSNKVKLLEGPIKDRSVAPDTINDRGISEASLASHSEISEVEDVVPGGQKTITPVSSSAHVRTLRKGSSEHLAINIDSESVGLINQEETDDDKGHVFKSLNTSGLIPKQGKVIADRIDGFWVSGGRALMSHPSARLGVIAYWLFVHIWLLGSIL